MNDSNHIQRIIEDLAQEVDLTKLRDEDFDRHTDFERLTVEQRLAWLSQFAQLAVMAKLITPIVPHSQFE